MVNAVALLYIFPFSHSDGLQAEEQRKRIRYTLVCELGGLDLLNLRHQLMLIMRNYLRLGCLFMIVSVLSTGSVKF